MNSTPNSIAPEPSLPEPTPFANGGCQAGPNEEFQTNSATLETLELANTSAITPSTAAKTPVRGASLRWNFSWTFVGNVIYSGCQWAMLVVLAKVGNPEMVGQYGLAMAVATPVLALSTLQLRAVLTTDVRKRIHFGEYLGFRLLTTLLSLVVIGAIALVMRFPGLLGGMFAGRTHYSRDSTWVILIVGVAQALEIVSDLYYARMQFYEHMDRIAKSMIVRGALGLAAMGAGIYLTHSVIWGALGLTLARALVILTYDIRRRTHVQPHQASDAKQSRDVQEAAQESLRPRWNASVQMELLRTSITLGVIAMLVSLLPNIPRYFIAGSQGERALGIFTATAFLVSSGNLIINALGQSAFVRLARHYGAGDVAGFNSLLLKLLGIAAVLGLGGIGVAVFFGHMLLTLLYRPEYAEHTDVLIAMMVGGAMTYVSGLMASAVTSARCFSRQIPVLATAVGAAALASMILVPKYGLLGAAFAVIITSTVLGAGEVVLLWYVLSNVNRLAEAEG
jgi:O-antigen/teichoic acid export membrane protein